MTPPSATERISSTPENPTRPSTPSLTGVVLVRPGATHLDEALAAIGAQTQRIDRLVVIDASGAETASGTASGDPEADDEVADERSLADRLAELRSGTRRLPHTLIRIDDEARLLPALNEALGARDTERSASAPSHGEIDAADEAEDSPTASSGAGSTAVAAGATTEWLWILEDDTVPGQMALERLLDTVVRSPSVGIAGPKLLRHGTERELVALGIQMTRAGRLVPSPAPGEIDQGQWDDRADVLAVPLAGMLVRRDVLTELGGFSSHVPARAAALDLGMRSQRAGHRVIVVPAARVHSGGGLGDLTGAAEHRPGSSVVTDEGAQPDPAEAKALRRRRAAAERADRRAARRVAIVRAHPLARPFMALWIALSSVGAALSLVVAKRPASARRELTDVRSVSALLATGAQSDPSPARVQRSDLRTLFVSQADAARHTLGVIHDTLMPGRTRAERTGASNPETGPVSSDSEALDTLPASLPRRIATNPGVLAVLAALAFSVFAWRDQLRGGALSTDGSGVAGGELATVTGRSSGLWSTATDTWAGAGLGHPARDLPQDTILAAIAWVGERLPQISGASAPVALSLTWLLLLAPLLATWAAYLAGRALTSLRWPRAIAALLWGGSSVLSAAVGQGRVTAALAHVVLPLVAAGFVTAARGGTFTATFATALALTILGACVPAYLVIAALAALVMLLFVRGARARALVLLAVPALLLYPHLDTWWHSWVELLRGPGLVTTSPPTPVWQLALGQPDPTTGYAVWLAAAVGLAVLAAAARPRLGRSRAAGAVVAGLVALVGLAAAIAANHLVVGAASTGAGTTAQARLWPGVPLQLYVLGLLGVLLAGLAPVRTLAETAAADDELPVRSPVVRRLVSALAVLVALGIPAAEGRHGHPDLTAQPATLPAIAVEQAQGPHATRTLLLEPTAQVVDYQLLGSEPGAVLRDVRRPASVGDPGVAALVERLAGGAGATPVSGSELSQLGIGFVLVAGPDLATVAPSLDASEGLTRLGTSPSGTLWRVQASDGTAASRARLQTQDGKHLQDVPVTGAHSRIDTQLPPAGEGRQLVIAEAPEWARHARVTVNGASVPLANASNGTVAAGEMPTYSVPPTGGQLVVTTASPDRGLGIARLVLLGLVIFMAIPLGSRRSRRRTS